MNPRAFRFVHGMPARRSSLDARAWETPHGGPWYFCASRHCEGRIHAASGLGHPHACTVPSEDEEWRITANPRPTLAEWPTIIAAATRDSESVEVAAGSLDDPATLIETVEAQISVGQCRALVNWLGNKPELKHDTWMRRLRRIVDSGATPDDPLEYERAPPAGHQLRNAGLISMEATERLCDARWLVHPKPAGAAALKLYDLATGMGRGQPPTPNNRRRPPMTPPTPQRSATDYLSIALSAFVICLLAVVAAAEGACRWIREQSEAARLEHARTLREIGDAPDAPR